MHELNIDTGVTGAKRQSWKRANPRDVLKRIIDKNPDYDEAQVQTECWEILHRDQQQIRTVFEYWFTNNYRSLVNPTTRPKKPAKAPETAPDRRQAGQSEAQGSEKEPSAPLSMPEIAVSQPITEMQARRTEVKDTIERAIATRIEIVLLDMVLPSGKALRHSTREELLELGGWAARVGAQLAPQQTVAQAGLSEEQLRALYEPVSI
jgi:hypothetical protein